MNLLLILFLTVFSLFVMVAMITSVFTNPKVLQEIEAQPDGERARIVMRLTFPNGKVLPVNYLREGDFVYAGADGPWWRAFRDGDVPVEVLIRGEVLHGRASAILDDPERVADVFSRLRVNVPNWLPRWADAKLVEIELIPSG